MWFGGMYVLVISKLSFRRAEGLYLFLDQAPEGQRGHGGGQRGRGALDIATMSSLPAFDSKIPRKSSPEVVDQ
jgi:hypothetical protein